MKFDGNTLHFTKKFSGERYAVIAHNDRTPCMMRDYLERLGFKFPSCAGGLEDGRLPARRNADRTLVDVALAGGRVKREMNELTPPIPCREAKARRATWLWLTGLLGLEDRLSRSMRPLASGL